MLPALLIPATGEGAGGRSSRPQRSRRLRRGGGPVRTPMAATAKSIEPRRSGSLCVSCP